MNKKKVIQDYINNFRISITNLLKPGIGVFCKIYPSQSAGSILEFHFDNNLKNDDEYLNDFQSINDALKIIEQHAFGGNLDGFKFSGTNIAMENNRIIIIKGEDDIAEWNLEGVKKDINIIINILSKGQK